MSSPPSPAVPELDGPGAFVRRPSRFRRWVTADGSSGFPAEAGRYHLYVSLACPWAHRTVIVRRLKGLEEAVSLSVVDPIRDSRGWRFTEGRGHGRYPVNGFEFLLEAYLATDPAYDGRATTPTLWDRQTGQVVSNESADIVRMLNAEFAAFADPAAPDLYPTELRAEIDALNERVYHNVNNGVYCAGFATSQDAYEEAFDGLFETLDWLEQRLGQRRYLTGERLTEADWRLFPTLVRFDAVYATHFKCNLRRLVDYPNLLGHTRELYQWPGIAETVDMDHIKRHYYMTHPELNPRRIVAKGPALDFTAPHGRG